MSGDFTSELKADPTSELLWAKWYRAIFPRVYSAAYSMSRGDVDSARDLAQEAFSRFIQYSALTKVTDDETAIKYLRTVCRHERITRLRRAHEKDHESGYNLENVPAPEEGSEKAVDLDLLARMLKGPDREIFDSARAGLSIAEIASNLAISYTAAGVRFHRMIQRLRASLKK